MGKGNRARNERASATLATASARNTRNQKKPMPTWMGTAIVVAVLVVLVLFTTFCILNSRGTFLRMRTVMETENFEITVPMMSYMVHTEYQNRLSMYGSSIGGTTGINIKGDSTGDALDSSKGLREQVYSRLPDENGNVVEVTWFDYFAGLATESARQVLACCEKAKYYGIELTEEDHAAIQSELNMLEYYAAIYGYTTSGYLGEMYGKGVALKDVQAMMELTKLASKYAALCDEEFYNAVSDARIQEYYKENQHELDKYIDYVGYSFTTKFTPDKDGDATKDEVKKYQDEQKKYANLVTALAATTDKHIFTETLQDFFYKEYLEEEKKKLLDKKTEGAELTPEEIARCEQEAAKRAWAEANAATVENYSKPSTTSSDKNVKAFIDWLFETKKNETTNKDEFLRQEGEVKEIKDVNEAKKNDEDKYTAVSSTYAVYRTTSGFHRDSSLIRDVGHILFKSTTYDEVTRSDSFTGEIKELADQILARDGILTAKTMAEGLLAKMKADGKIETVTEGGVTYYVIDKDVFEEYGNIYTGDGSVFYEKVGAGQMVEEFEDWLFDAARKEGEISYPEAVETTYGYHIMMYCGNQKDAWSHNIRTTLSGEDYEDYMADLKENAPITFKQKNLKYISD